VLFSVGIAVDADRSDQAVLHHLNLRKYVAVAGNKDCTDVAYIAEHQSPEDVDQDLGVQAIVSQLIQQIGVLACHRLNFLRLHRFFTGWCFPRSPDIVQLH